MLAGKIFETNQKFHEYRFADESAIAEIDGIWFKPTSLFVVEKSTGYGDDNIGVTSLTVKLTGVKKLGETFSGQAIFKWGNGERNPLHYIPDWLQEHLRSLKVLGFA